MPHIHLNKPHGDKLSDPVLSIYVNQPNQIPQALLNLPENTLRKLALMSIFIGAFLIICMSALFYIVKQNEKLQLQSLTQDPNREISTTTAAQTQALTSAESVSHLTPVSNIETHNSKLTCTEQDCLFEITITNNDSTHKVTGQIISVLEVNFPHLGIKSGASIQRKRFYIYPNSMSADQFKNEDLDAVTGKSFNFSTVLALSIPFRIDRFTTPISAHLFAKHDNGQTVLLKTELLASEKSP